MAKPIKPRPKFNNWDECFNYWAKHRQKKYPYFLEWLKLKAEPPKLIKQSEDK